MIGSLERELETILRLSGVSHVTSVYFGGGTCIGIVIYFPLSTCNSVVIEGTPSLASARMVESVLNVISRKVSLYSGAEVTLEANPSSLDISKLR